MAHCKGLWLLLITGLILLPGCGGGGGGGDVSTAIITGTVTVNSMPASGTVSLLNSTGVIDSVTISGGSFTFSNVIPGSYRVLYQYNSSSFYSPEGGSYRPVTLSGPNIFTIDAGTPPAPPGS